MHITDIDRVTPHVFIYCVPLIGSLADLTYEFVVDSQFLFFHSIDHYWIVYFYLLYQTESLIPLPSVSSCMIMRLLTPNSCASSLAVA